MKKKLIIILSGISILMACSKENDVWQKQSLSATVNVLSALIDTVKIPLIDMGENTFMGYHGGLYPDGSNTASGQYATDLQTFANAIVPLNSDGIRDDSKGKVGFIAIGASTCALMMNALKGKTLNNPVTNPALKLVSCTDGGSSINEIMNPNDPYWSTADSKLSKANLTKKQVEVVYVETEDSITSISFPERPTFTKDHYAQTMRTLKVKYPNVKIVYLLGRTTTFIASKPKGKNLNSEPVPYYNGWACKFLIEDQINGVPGLRYKGNDAVAPMVTWGWYEWANGSTTPRSDGFVWTIADTKDGLHANTMGQDTLSTYFQNFLLTNPVANTWYAKH